MAYLRRDEEYTSIAIKVKTHKKLKELARRNGMWIKDFIEDFANKLIKNNE